MKIAVRQKGYQFKIELGGVRAQLSRVFAGCFIKLSGSEIVAMMQATESRHGDNSATRA